VRTPANEIDEYISNIGIYSVYPLWWINRFGDGFGKAYVDKCKADGKELSKDEANDYSNAARHAAGMMLASLYYGRETAETIGDIHEYTNWHGYGLSSRRYADSVIDQYNNEQARVIAETIRLQENYKKQSWDNIKNQIMEKVQIELEKGEQGAFIIKPTDPRYREAIIFWEKRLLEYRKYQERIVQEEKQ